MNNIEKAIGILKEEKKKQIVIMHSLPPRNRDRAIDVAMMIKSLSLAIDALNQQLTNGWIPVSERLPEEKINPVTSDYYEYECTADWVWDRTDIRYYKFGDGHWWNSPSCVDAYVIAWREIPEPYKGESNE